MWKIFENLKNDFEKGVNDIANEDFNAKDHSEAEAQALERGKESVQGNSIIALTDGTVEMINQDADQIEIYMDKGQGYGIQFPLGPAAYSVKVSVNEKVKKGQTLVTFGPDAVRDARVFAFTPNMIKVLSNSRFRIE